MSKRPAGRFVDEPTRGTIEVDGVTRSTLVFQTKMRRVYLGLALCAILLAVGFGGLIDASAAPSRRILLGLVVLAFGAFLVVGLPQVRHPGYEGFQARRLLGMVGRSGASRPRPIGLGRHVRAADDRRRRRTTQPRREIRARAGGSPRARLIPTFHVTAGHLIAYTYRTKQDLRIRERTVGAARDDDIQA